MKNQINRGLNLALWLGFCALAGTGFVLAYRLPPGSRGGRGLTLLGIDRHGWGDIHTWIAWGAVACVLGHLAMNWTWLRKIAAGARPWRLAAGLGAGLALVAALLLIPVERRGRDGGDEGDGPPRGAGRRARQGMQQRGQPETERRAPEPGRKAGGGPPEQAGDSGAR